MAIITISRVVFSGGEAVAECVAGRLGHRCLGREALVEAAAAGGVPESELHDALVKSPGLLERLGSRRRLYLALLQSALAEEAAGGELVYHGNAGHLLLPASAPVLRVRIVAPLDYRLALARERMGMGPEEGAAFIAHADEDRRHWTRFLYGVDWGDPSLYDLTLNLKRSGIEDACDVVAGMAGMECFVLTPERRAALKDFALASRVRAVLGLDPGTAQIEVEVSCRSGIVEVRGFVGSQRGIREVERVAGGVPGVRELELDDLVVYHDV